MRNARSLYDEMGLTALIEACDHEINTLTQLNADIPQHLTLWQRIKQSLQRLLQWMRSFF